MCDPLGGARRQIAGTRSGPRDGTWERDPQRFSKDIIGRGESWIAEYDAGVPKRARRVANRAG